MCIGFSFSQRLSFRAAAAASLVGLGGIGAHRVVAQQIA